MNECLMIFNNIIPCNMNILKMNFSLLKYFLKIAKVITQLMSNYVASVHFDWACKMNEVKCKWLD